MVDRRWQQEKEEGSALQERRSKGKKRTTTYQPNNFTYRGNGAWSSGEDSHNGGGGDE